MFVEFASAADRLLVVARTSGEPPSSDGITMFLVDAESSGIQLKPLRTMARDKQFQVALEGVKVTMDDVLGPVGGAWPLLEKVVHQGVLAFCAYMVGASENIHQMTTGFAKDRVQFDRPIGSFQAIQHYLAQSITEIIAADTTAFYAAWALDKGMPAREIVAKAKAFAGDTFKQASAIGAQIHGGIGFNEDVDTTLFLRRGKQYQLSMGDSSYWEGVIAEEILDR
jgi:alkylation response protein AidB-like acyl-CoA dehydrogenase